MTEDRVLGVDPGEHRIGVAISDPLGIIAQPHSVIDRRRTDAIARIEELCTEYNVTTVVVGLPISLSGHEGEAAQAARAFGADITTATSRNLVYWDERFTTVQAEQALIDSGMKRKARRVKTDQVAAAMILQGFLDSRRREET